MAARKQVQLYTDGSSRGNPGPGGYGTVLTFGPYRKELSQGYKRTTNNRMEVMAVIAGLELLKEPCVVEVYSDSRYVVDCMNKGWLKGWKAKGWKKKDKSAVKNVDLWKRLETAMGDHEIEWIWVKGHAGHRENEMCDELARAAAENPTDEDTGYQPS